MLMQVGLVTFDLKFNLDSIGRQTVRDYAEKPVIGAMPSLEDMGDGPETLSFSGRIISQRLGGLDGLPVLRKAQRTGLPQLVMRGDGAVLGFYVIRGVADDHAFLNAAGVGQVVDIGIDLQKTADPDGRSYFTSLWDLLR